MIRHNHHALLRTAGPAAVLLLAASSASAQTLDRRVRIVNDSRHDIVAFYGTNVGVREWQENLLGSGTLPAGAALVLDFEDGSGYCRFRFRAVFEDRVELERRSVNVCEVGTYRYTD